MTETPSSSDRQVVLVFDLNKCMGCQACSIACKMLWTRGEGEEHPWWCTTNTMPGRGTPRDWEQMGGGYRGGELVLGHEPTLEEFGGGWKYNEEEVFYVPPLSPYRLREDRSIDTETMRIPPEYLESLFGPAVHEVLAKLRSEIERVRGGGRSELLDTLIVYQWKTLFGPFAEEPAVVDAVREAAG